MSGREMSPEPEGAVTSVDPRPIHDYAVDRSFLFFIHDDRGNVLFGGRVIDPS